MVHGTSQVIEGMIERGEARKRKKGMGGREQNNRPPKFDVTMVPSSSYSIMVPILQCCEGECGTKMTHNKGSS